MNDASKFTELFEHSAWVRALALRLCNDSHAADDVAQEVWFRALRRPAGARSAREWLGGIARHVAARRRTSEASRVQRERRASRPEAVPSPADLLAEAELQRKILAAVADLPEQQRVVVLLRYYEGASAEEIAKRLGAPSSTIRNRLARALERLRERLDGEYGTRSTWTAIAAPSLAWQTSLVTAGAGMGAKALTAAGLVAAGVVALVWNARAPAGSMADAGARTAGALAAVATETSDAGTSLRVATNRDEGDRRVTLEPPAAPRFEQLLVHGTLHGLTSVDASVSSLRFLDEHGGSRPASLDANGAYSSFGLAPGVWRVWGRLSGFLPLDVELELDGSVERVRRDFTLVPAQVLAVKFLDVATGERLEFPPFDPIGDGLGVVVSEHPLARAKGIGSRRPLGSEFAEYRPLPGGLTKLDLPAGSSGRLTVFAPPPLFAHAVLREHVLESRPIDGTETELVFALDRARLEAALSSLVVRCVDARSGAALPKSRVELGFDDGSGERVETDAEGRARLERLAPGMRELSVWATGFAGVHRSLRLAPGETLDLGELELHPPVRVRGRVLAPDGAGASAQLAYTVVGRDGLAIDALTKLSARTALNGQFDLKQLESGRLRLVAWAEGFATSWIEFEASGEVVSELELRLQHGFEVRVAAPRGALASAQVRLRDARGVTLHVDRVVPPNPLRWTLAPGAYELSRIVDDSVAATQTFVVEDRALSLELVTP
jgi:RNA polymerase sigma-70 factor (ECF subfamily)